MGTGSQLGQGLMNVPTGALTDDQKANLTFMVEEEKLAHDVYTVRVTAPDVAPVYSNLTRASQRHLAVFQSRP